MSEAGHRSLIDTRIMLQLAGQAGDSQACAGGRSQRPGLPGSAGQRLHLPAGLPTWLRIQCSDDVAAIVHQPANNPSL